MYNLIKIFLQTGGFHGLASLTAFTYNTGRVLGDMPGRSLAEFTTKVAKILKDHPMPQKFSKKYKGENCLGKPHVVFTFNY